MSLKLFIKKIIPNVLLARIQRSDLYIFRILFSEIRQLRHPKQFFGQTAEDALLQRYIPFKHGTYIDVGSGHPVIGSNTYAFYRQGWRGICVDPISENQKLFSYLRRGDKYLRALVGLDGNEISFWEFRPYELSTGNLEVANKLLNRHDVKFISESKLRTISLENIFSHAEKDLPTLLAIDVEGMDLEVLQSNNWDRFRPDVICVEEWRDSQTISPVLEYLSKLDYEKVAYTGLSSIFIRNGFPRYF
jgi:FkbM family methyltransferase